jgi:phosphate transport system ATP-binding protein
VDLSKPPPVRRLTASGTIPSAPPSGNGNGRHPVLAPAPPDDSPTQVIAPSFRGGARLIEPASIVIDRMAVERLSVNYGSKRAVNEVTLPIRQGEVLALIGPSGCGKTTLLRSLNRLTEVTKGTSHSGRITLDGLDIASMDPTDLRRRVTMVFQQPNPFPMSIFDNVAYVLREQARRRPRRKDLQRPVEDALARAGLLKEVKDDLKHPALRLSGGQQQRLCIARALAARPEVLLLDEPCSALDPQSTRVIEELIVKLRDDVAVVIVTHNLQQARRVADYVAFMYLGELVEYGAAKQIFGSPREQRTKEYISGAFG